MRLLGFVRRRSLELVLIVLIVGAIVMYVVESVQLRKNARSRTNLDQSKLRVVETADGGCVQVYRHEYGGCAGNEVFVVPCVCQ